MRVGITYNLKKHILQGPPDAEAEFDDADTILALRAALEAAGHTVEDFEAEEDLPLRLLRQRPDIVFNIAEGSAGRGRESHVPALLSFLGIPFTGSDETAMCIAMDKALTKRLVASCAVPTPGFRVVKDVADLSNLSFTQPVIVKPNTEGSSKGITHLSIAMDEVGLREIVAEKVSVYRQEMIVETYVPGREFTVGLLGNGDGLRIFPPMEILFLDQTRPVYSYDVKREFRKYVRYECPADLDARLTDEIRSAAETVYRVLGCKDLARVDFRLSPEGRLYFIEINPLPGLAPDYSDLPILASRCGMDYPSLIRTILDSALTRYGLTTQGGQD